MMVGGGRAEEERKLRRNYDGCNRTTLFIRRKKRERSDRHEERSGRDNEDDCDAHRVW